MYHHFKGNALSRSEKIQRSVAEKILNSKLSEAWRESSAIWELKHSASCTQVARILAMKRNLDLELAEVIAALHDLAVIETGTYKDHAIKSAELAEPLLKEFTESEKKTILEAITSHSSKNKYSEKPYAELIKDADTFDCFLYALNDENIYDDKTGEVREEYFKRFEKVKEELGL